MAEKIPAADPNERLKIWLSFAKFCIAALLISFTLLAINDQKMKAKIRVARIEAESACDDDGADEAMEAQGAEAHAAKPKKGN